jgi:hypothetical protein
MVKRLFKSALVVSIATGGLITLAAAPSSAATTTLTAGPGSSLNCTIETTTTTPAVAKDPAIKLVPPLKNDFSQSQYSGDADFQSQSVLTSIPNNAYGANGGLQGTSSTKGVAFCSGTIVDGSTSLNVSNVTAAYSLATTTQGHGNGSVDPNTCTAQLENTDTGALFSDTIKYSGLPTGFKLAETFVTGAHVSQYVQGGNDGGQYSGGTITGSFAGGSDSNINDIDTGASGPISEITQPAETGSQIVANNGSYVSLGCQPSFKVKYGKGAEAQNGSDPTLVTATLVAPKGLKAITTVAGSLDLSA